MTKRFVVFAISLIVSIFVVGCQPVKPKTVEPPKAESSKVELSRPEPLRIEHPKPVPPKPAPVKVEPPKVEPAKPEFRPAVPFHDKCANILRNYVDEKGMVDYKSLKRKKSELKKLLDEFAKLDPNEYSRWSKEDKIAFWINAYNIQTLKIIVDNYPIKSSRILRVFWGPKSIRHIDKYIGGIDKQKFIVMDEEFALVEVQRRFLRKQFDEPRMFFAICNASISSPPLRNEPYYGDKLGEQLDDQTKRFLSSHGALEIDRDKQTVYLSAILQQTWFGGEFVNKYGTDKKFKDQQPTTAAVLNFISNYVSEQDVSFLETGNYSIEYIKYDWTLNE